MASVMINSEKQPTSILEQQANVLKTLIPDIALAIELATKEVSLLSTFHAKTAPGTYLYQETLRYLRESLKKYNFEALYLGGVELTYNQELGIALYYCRVNKDIKSLDSYPLSLRKRGEHTKKLLHLSENSQLNPDLFPETLELSNYDNLAPLMNIWVIMLYADTKTEEYIANIGYPESVDRYSRIDSFSHRMALPLNLPEIITEKLPDFAENPETDIQIKDEKLIA